MEKKSKIDVDYHRDVDFEEKKLHNSLIKDLANNKIGITKEKILNLSTLRGESENQTVLNLIESANKIINNNADGNDKMIVSYVLPNILKKNISESIFMKYMKQIPEISIKKLPQRGKNALYPYSKIGFISGKDIQNNIFEQEIHNKAIDFKITINNKQQKNKTTIFIQHKMTFHKGGAQDNQCAELMNNMSAIKDALDGTNIYFISVGDGEYYNDDETIKKLKSLETSNVKYMNTNNLIDFINSQKGVD